jgi:hypothetical protein
MLHVFENEEDRLKMKSLMEQTESGTYLPHGLTIPTYHIVERKYKKTRKHKKKPLHKISETMDQIETPWGYVQDAATGAVLPNKREFVEVFEEVVPFEEWMYDSVSNKCITIEINDSTDINSKEMNILVEHPNLLVSQLDLDEERELEEEEQMRRALAIDREHSGADVLKTIVSQTFASESKDNMKLSLRIKEASTKESSHTSGQNDSDGSDDSDDDFDLDAALQDKVDSAASESRDQDPKPRPQSNGMSMTENTTYIENTEGKDGSVDESSEVEDTEDDEEEDEDESWMNIE